MYLELRALAGWLVFGVLQGLAIEAILACCVGLRPWLLLLLVTCLSLKVLHLLELILLNCIAFPLALVFFHQEQKISISISGSPIIFQGQINASRCPVFP